MAEIESVIIELGIDTKEFEARAEASAKDVQNLTARLKEMKEAGKDNTAEFARTQAALNSAKKEYRDSVKGIEQLTKIQDTNTGALEKQRLGTALLKSEFAKLSDEQLENEEVAKKWKDATLEANEATKRTEEGIGVFTRSVGDYTRSIVDALDQTGLLGGAFRNMQSSLSGVNSGVLKGAKGMQLFKIALASTGVGALVVALGSLLAFFTKTKKGADLLRQGMAWMEGVFSAITGVAVKLGENIVSLFTTPQQALKDFGQLLLDQIVNRFMAAIDIGGALARMLRSLVTGDMEGLKVAAQDAGTALIQLGTGMDEAQQAGAADFFKNMGKEISKSANESLNLEKRMQALRDLSRTMKVDIAELSKEIELQIEIAGDSTRSFVEMEAAAEKTRAALEKRSAKEVELAQKELEIVNERLAIARRNGQETNDLLDEQAEAQQRLIEVETQAMLTEKQNEKERRQLKQDRLERDLDFLLDIFDNQKTINERIIQDETVTFERRAQLLQQTQQLAQKSFEEQAAIIQQFTNQKINFDQLIAESDAKVVQEKVRALGLSEIIEGRLLEVIRDRKTAVQDLADTEKELAQSRNEQIETNLQNEIKAVQESTETRLKQLELELLQSSQTREQIEMQLLQRRIELKQQEVMTLKALDQETLDAQIEIADMQRQLAEERTSQQIEEQRKQTEAVMAMASSVGDVVAQAAERGEDILKAAAKQTVLILINELEAAAIQAVARFTLQEVATKGPVGFITGAIGAAAIKALSGVAKAKIQSFHQGGLVQLGQFQGPASSQDTIYGQFSDGTKVRVQPDEIFAVLNKRASNAIQGMSALNHQYGGAAYTRPYHFQAGGMLSQVQNISTGVDGNQVRTIVNEVINNAPRPVVAVESINNMNGRITSVERQSNL